MATVTHEMLLTRRLIDYEDGYTVDVRQAENGITAIEQQDGHDIELTPTMARLVAKALCESADEQERRMAQR